MNVIFNKILMKETKLSHFYCVGLKNQSLLFLHLGCLDLPPLLDRCKKSRLKCSNNFNLLNLFNNVYSNLIYKYKFKF